MAQVTIRALKNGPYEVSGKPAVIDFEGAAYQVDEDPIYLCRCGGSATKPSCDGTHKKVGFDAVECVRMATGR
jgi:3-phenylpropionate/trans-cinnamate dioxygenase ferredoxin subunit